MATYFGREYTNIGTESVDIWKLAGGGNESGSNLGTIGELSCATSAFKMISSNISTYHYQLFQGLSYPNGGSASGYNDHYSKFQNISGQKLMLVALEGGIGTMGQRGPLTASGYSNEAYLPHVISNNNTNGNGVITQAYNMGGYYGPQFLNPVHLCVEPDAQLYVMRRPSLGRYRVLTSWLGHSADDWHAAALANQVADLGYNDDVAARVWSEGVIETLNNISIEGTDGLIQ